MDLEPHARISEDAEARIPEEAVESSYRKGGINACIGEREVSKETVMNKLHALPYVVTGTTIPVAEVIFTHFQDTNNSSVVLHFALLSDI